MVRFNYEVSPLGGSATVMNGTIRMSLFWVGHVAMDSTIIMQSSSMFHILSFCGSFEVCEKIHNVLVQAVPNRCHTQCLISSDSILASAS